MKQSELRQIIKEEISKILNENEIKPGDSFKNYKGSIHTVVSVSPNGNQIKAKDEKGNVLTFRWYNSSGKYIEGKTNELGIPIKTEK